MGNFIVFCLLGAFFLSRPVQAIELVKLLGVSVSGNTIKIDKGSFERVEQKDIARFMVEGVGDNPMILNVGEGEAVKVYSNYSIWHLPKAQNIHKLRKAKKIFVAFYSETIKGRRKFKVLQKKIVASREEVLKKGVDRAIEDSLKPIPDSLIKKGEEYGSGDQLVETKIPNKHDALTVDFDIWSEEDDHKIDPELGKEVGKKVQENPSVIADAKKIKKREMKKIFNSTVDGNLAKVNNAKGGPRGFYSQQRKDEHLREFKNRQLVRNVYDNYLKERRKKRLQKKRALERLAIDYERRKKTKGELWSADMDDEQLRRFYVESGVAREHERQQLLASTSINNEIFIRYQRSFLDHTSELSDFGRGIGTAFEMGHEYHLVRTSQKLSPFTLGFFVGLGKGHYHLGNGVNGETSEKTIGASFNWYFYNLPYMFRKYIFHVGTGMRVGSADISSLQLAEDYSYEMQVLPAAYLGVKYHYQMPKEEGSDFGIGMNFLFSIERIRLSTNNPLNSTDDIDGLINLTDIKLSAGLSIFF